MAGEAISQAIFFISSVLIAMVVVVALFTAVSSLSSAYTAKNVHTGEQLRTSVEIVNDPLGTNRTYIYVLNNGLTMLNHTYPNVVVFINGKATTDLNASEIVNDGDGDGIWDPGEMIQIHRSSGDAYSSGDLVQVMVSNGVYDTKQL
ncbi:MAG: hypothetical protein ACXQT3_00205 [Methermicoccaceae archaeon]